MKTIKYKNRNSFLKSKQKSGKIIKNKSIWFLYSINIKEVRMMIGG